MTVWFKSISPIHGFLAVLGIVLSNGSANAQTGYDLDDFIVAFSLSDNIAVFDSDRTFKGFLDDDFNGVTGLDFDAAGRVVATSALEDEVRVYTPDGNLVPELSFENDAIGLAFDLKVGPSGNYFIGTGSSRGGRGITEFTPSGDAVRFFDNPDSANSANYSGVAVLPGDVLWGGGFGLPPRGFIDVHDIGSDGSQVAPVSRIDLDSDSDQIVANAMFYDPATETVLTTDIDTDKIYERDLDGNFIREFAIPDGLSPGMRTPSGITRGPNGDVYVANQGTLGSSDGVGIFVWDASGDFVEFIDFDGTGLRAPVGILYGGNSPIPEPASVALLGLAGLGLLLLGRRRAP